MNVNLKFLSFLAVGTLMSVSAFAVTDDGGATSGGGDPLEIVATAYSNLQQLDAAIAIAQARVEASQYLPAFKVAMADEIQKLRENGKFRMLPALIILEPGTGPKGYEFPQDGDRFVALGGMTRNHLGAPVYFAERVTQYDVERLAELMVHEVLHHVTPTYSAANERFIEELATSIMSGVVQQKLEIGLKYGLVIRDNFVSGQGLAYGVFKELLKAGVDHFALGGKELERGNLSIDEIIELSLRYSRLMPKNVLEMSVDEVVERIVGKMEYSVSDDDDEFHERHDLSERVEWYIFAFARRLDPSNQWLDQTCKVKLSWWKRALSLYFHCPTEDRVLMKEIFDASRL